MASSNARNITTGVLVVLLFGALALAFLRPTSEITVQNGQVTGVEEATAETALVTSISEEGGFRFLGITFSSPKHRVQVGFTAPPDCIEVLETAAVWPTGNRGCGRDGGLTGDISGSGRTADGRAIVSVKFEVTEECHDVLTAGDIWGTHPECRETTG